jgi:hypothetical protein
MRICNVIGVVHPDHLLDVMTQRQLEDRIAFEQIEPSGTPVSDYHAALVAWAAARNRKAKISHFIPMWGGQDPVDPETYKLKAKAVYGRASRGLKENG